MDEKIYEIEKLSQSEPITTEVLNESLELALQLVPEVPNMSEEQKQRFQEAVVTLANAEQPESELQ